MATITRAQVRTMIQERADILGDTVRYTDSVLNRDITDSLNKLQIRLLPHGVLKDEDVAEIATDGSIEYTLNAEAIAILSVHRVDGTDIFTPLTKISPSELPIRQSAIEGIATKYRLYNHEGDNKIVFYPRPTSGTYTYVFIPLRTLTADTDTLAIELGWHEYIVADCCRKVYRRENLDANPHIQDREIAFAEILDGEEARDLHSTYKIRNVSKSTETIDPADVGPYRWGQGD